MCYRFGHCIIVLFLFSLLFVFFKLWTRNRGNHNAQKCIKYINKISSNLLWILNTYAKKCAVSFHLYIFLILPKINWSVAIWNTMRVLNNYYIYHFIHNYSLFLLCWVSINEKISRMNSSTSVHCQMENNKTYKKILKIARPSFLLVWQLSGVPITVLNVELYFLCTLMVSSWWSSLSKA